MSLIWENLNDEKTSQAKEAFELLKTNIPDYKDLLEPP